MRRASQRIRRYRSAYCARLRSSALFLIDQIESHLGARSFDCFLDPIIFVIRNGERVEFGDALSIGRMMAPCLEITRHLRNFNGHITYRIVSGIMLDNAICRWVHSADNERGRWVNDAGAVDDEISVHFTISIDVAMSSSVFVGVVIRNDTG